jgi:hypothetical protein
MNKKTENQLKGIIEDIILDIEELGLDGLCLLYVDKKKNTLIDYLPLKLAKDEEREDGLYIDEKREQVTLFEALYQFVCAFLAEFHKQATLYSVFIVICEIMIKKPLTEIARAAEIPYRTLQDWKAGLYTPRNIQEFLKVLKVCGIPAQKFFEKL